MSDNKRKKMASKKAKAQAKKAKIKAKMKVVLAAFALAAICGCSTSEPASRLTKAEYGDIIIRLDNAWSNTVNLTIGDGAYASADSDGSTETMTANPTNTTDIKPDVNVNTTGGRTAGILETALSAGAALIKGDGADASSSPCKNCGECEDCEYKP